MKTRKKDESSPCIRTCSQSKILVCDKKSSTSDRKVVFLNEDRKDYLLISVDGCMIKNQTASDYILSQNQIGDVVIELKGTDVEHAVEQVTLTMEWWSKQAIRAETKKLAGLIICTRYPRFDTKIQRYKSLLLKKFGAALSVRCGKAELRFESIINHS